MNHHLVRVSNRQRRFRVVPDRVRAVCGGVLRALAAEPRAIDVVFVGSAGIRRLNRRYRGKDYATDVLSFGYSGQTDEVGLPWLGEMVLSPDVALVNALRLRTSPEREIRRLLVHGTLHLLGYDHETDDG